MKTITIFSTSGSSWYQEKANKVAEALSQTKGREKVEFEVIKIGPPKNIQLAPDSDGDMKPSWDWMNYFFNTHERDGVVFHFTPYYRDKWMVSGRINGSRNSLSTEKPIFWICCDKENAKGYENLSQFERLLYHEWGHYDEDLDMALPQESVHNMDYKLKAIDLHHKVVDLRPYNFNKKLQPILEKIIYLMKYVLPKT